MPHGVTSSLSLASPMLFWLRGRSDSATTKKRHWLGVALVGTLMHYAHAKRRRKGAPACPGNRPRRFLSSSGPFGARCRKEALRLCGSGSPSHDCRAAACLTSRRVPEGACSQSHASPIPLVGPCELPIRTKCGDDYALDVISTTDIVHDWPVIPVPEHRQNALMHGSRYCLALNVDCAGFHRDPREMRHAGWPGGSSGGDLYLQTTNDRSNPTHRPR